MLNFFFLSVQIKELYDSIIISGSGTVLRSDILDVGILNSMILATMESGITEIGPNSFEGLSKLEKVIFPDTLQKIGGYAFNGCGKLSIADFSNLKNLHTICQYAFTGTIISGTVTIPEKVTLLETYALARNRISEIIFKNTGSCKLVRLCFGYLNDLKGTLTLGTTLDIELWAFISCSLTSIYVGSDVKIEYNPFAYSLTVTTIQFLTPEIPSPYICIENNVIYNISKTNLITFPGAVSTKFQCPSEVKYIKNNAFRRCMLEEAVLESVQTIELQAFADSSIKKVVFRDLKNLNSRCFENSLLVEEIILPEGFMNIQNAAFGGCSSLKKVYIPSTLQTVAGNPFGGCSNLVITVNESCPIIQSDNDGIIYTDSFKKYLFIPNNLTNISVPIPMTDISASSFKLMRNIVEIKFLGQITALRSECMASCSGLKTLYIPNSLTTWEANTMTDCTALERVEIEKGCAINVIPSHTFSGCHSLSELVLNDAPIITFSQNSFAQCRALTNFTFPKTTETIDQYAFTGCTKLVSIFLQSTNPVTIHFACFISCPNFKSIKIDTIKISTMAFQNLAELKQLDLYSKIEEIESLAFSGCSSLHSISFINNNVLKKLGSNSFAYCIALESITLPGSLLTIDGSVFTGCTSLINVKILNEDRFETNNYLVYEKECKTLLLCPAGLREAHVNENTQILGRMSFSGCLNLESIYLSARVKNISGFCFQRCESLQMLNIPQGIQNIGEDIFIGCKSLNKISFCGLNDNQITYHPNVNFPASVLVLVAHNYGNNKFLQSDVYRSNSIDPFGCPNYPTGLFSMGRRKHLQSANIKLILLCPIFNLFRSS